MTAPREVARRPAPFWLPVAFFCAVACGAIAALASAEETMRGRVLDAETRQPIAGAVVTTDGRTVETDVDGGFEVPVGTPEVLVRAVGQIPYPTTVPLAIAVGAQRPFTIPDPAALIGQLRARGIYLIARIVVFKDSPLATARPDLAVRRADGALFRDREHLAWTDPFRAEVRDYNVDVAVEAARLGFDEIQFDYVRFPDAVGLRFAAPSTQASRVAAIGDLMREARRRLAPYNVFLSADVFGYVCWNPDDTLIGQRLEDLAPLVDYLSPMLYPSAFQFGIPGHRDPVAHPSEIVRKSLDEAQRRTGLPGVRFRPWLQAFKDYAFDRRVFGADEIQRQIQGAERAGSGGWMLWNPRNDYAATGLAE